MAPQCSQTRCPTSRPPPACKRSWATRYWMKALLGDLARPAPRRRTRKPAAHTCELYAATTVRTATACTGRAGSKGAQRWRRPKQIAPRGCGVRGALAAPALGVVLEGALKSLRRELLDAASSELAAAFDNVAADHATQRPLVALALPGTVRPAPSQRATSSVNGWTGSSGAGGGSRDPGGAPGGAARLGASAGGRARPPAAAGAGLPRGSGGAGLRGCLPAAATQMVCGVRMLQRASVPKHEEASATASVVGGGMLPHSHVRHPIALALHSPTISLSYINLTSDAQLRDSFARGRLPLSLPSCCRPEASSRIFTSTTQRSIGYGSRSCQAAAERQRPPRAVSRGARGQGRAASHGRSRPLACGGARQPGAALRGHASQRGIHAD